eukprot:maker-scaffold_6-snap-gene-16.23-mRNA-1 protein AED:0.34 eAED:0.34 QI:13/0.5/0.33/1/1/1/3/0/819
MNVKMKKQRQVYAYERLRESVSQGFTMLKCEASLLENRNGFSTFVRILHKENNLTYLNLEGNCLGDNGVRELCNAFFTSKFKHLSILGLSKNGISKVGAESLSRLISSDLPLTCLDLDQNKLGDSGMSILSTALQNSSSITDLYLKANEIGDSGATSLASVFFNNRCLAYVDLEDNYITQSGLKSLLNGLENNPVITDLYLGNNEIKVGRKNVELRLLLQKLGRNKKSIGDLYRKILKCPDEYFLSSSINRVFILDLRSKKEQNFFPEANEVYKFVNGQKIKKFPGSFHDLSYTLAAEVCLKELDKPQRTSFKIPFQDFELASKSKKRKKSFFSQFSVGSVDSSLEGGLNTEIESKTKPELRKEFLITQEEVDHYFERAKTSQTRGKRNCFVSFLKLPDHSDLEATNLLNQICVGSNRKSLQLIVFVDKIDDSLKFWLSFLSLQEDPQVCIICQKTEKELTQKIRQVVSKIFYPNGNLSQSFRVVPARFSSTRMQHRKRSTNFPTNLGFKKHVSFQLDQADRSQLLRMGNVSVVLGSDIELGLQKLFSSLTSENETPLSWLLFLKEVLGKTTISSKQAKSLCQQVRCAPYKDLKELNSRGWLFFSSEKQRTSKFIICNLFEAVSSLRRVLETHYVRDGNLVLLEDSLENEIGKVCNNSKLSNFYFELLKDILVIHEFGEIDGEVLYLLQYGQGSGERTTSPKFVIDFSENWLFSSVSCRFLSLYGSSRSAEITVRQTKYTLEISCIKSPKLALQKSRRIMKKISEEYFRGNLKFNFFVELEETQKLLSVDRAEIKKLSPWFTTEELSLVSSIEHLDNFV